MLTESGNRAVLAEADGSASQLWRVSALGGGRYSFTSASGLALDDRGQRTSEGNTVWLYEPNGGGPPRRGSLPSLQDLSKKF